jgi:hypothetical protein
VKRSGRDESVWVAIHMFMEAILGISLHSYPYLKLAKPLCLFYYCLCLLFNKIENYLEMRGFGGRRRVAGSRGRDGPMYAHMNK